MHFRYWRPSAFTLFFVLSISSNSSDAENNEYSVTETEFSVQSFNTPSDTFLGAFGEDFDGDGDWDFVVTGGTFPPEEKREPQEGIVLLNNGDNTFSIAEGDGPFNEGAREIQVQDFDGDGIRDIFISEQGYDGAPFPGLKDTLLLGTGNGFVNASDRLPDIDAFSHNAASGDIDNDGDIDLFVGNTENGEPNEVSYLLFNDGEANFELNRAKVPASLIDFDPDLQTTFAADFGDFDNDGWLDLVVGRTQGENNLATRIHWNDGQGGFSDNDVTFLDDEDLYGNPDQTEVVEILARDIDSDGDEDLVVVSFAKSSEFQDVTFTGGIGRSIRILINNGNRAFVDESETRLGSVARSTATDASSPMFLYFLDVNNDGKEDIVSVGFGDTRDDYPVLWEGLGQGCFNPITFADIANAGDESTRLNVTTSNVSYSPSTGIRYIGFVMLSDEQRLVTNELSLVVEESQSGPVSNPCADSDSDGIADDDDAFPLDPTETTDTDNDGIGNNEDTDDDGDTLPDTYEEANGLDPLVDDTNEDPDGDGLSNLQEFELGLNPQQFDELTACEDPNTIADTSASSSLSFQRRIPFANPGSNSTQQTFLRFINPNNVATDVEVYGIDDDGANNKSGAMSFTLEPQSALQFTAQDMENGNTSKGLSSNFCDGEGKWQLIVRSENSIEVMSLIRAPGGFLTSLNEVVPTDGNENLVYFANTASEPSQQTFLRILNRGTESGTVTISGIDDAGNPGASSITFNLTANDAQQMTSQDLENGNASKGLSGALGDGEGNWRLTINSSLDLDVMSLIRLPGGYLTNLSGIAPGTGTSRELLFVEPADETLRTSSIRVINTSSELSTITVSATDDTGAAAPNGDVSFTLSASAAREISITDLESGAEDLSGMLGDGQGRWRMVVSSDNSLEVMSLIETAEGFLTNLSRAVPSESNVHEVLVFNPASNTTRRSKLRLVNDGNTQASLSISGYDDAGQTGDTDVTLNLTAGASIEVSAVDLEEGNSELGLVGALGDGQGKWRLIITSSDPIEVQGILDTPDGFITNLSRATEDESTGL